jgi:predicted PurR-regulated permease PerM
LLNRKDTITDGKIHQASSPSGDPWLRALFLPLTLLAWLAIALVILWMLGHVTHALVVIILSVILAFALAPLVALLRRRLNRPLAIAGAYLVGVAIVVGFGSLLLITAAGQVINLVQNLPDYVGRIKEIGPQALVLLGPFGLTSDNLQTLNQQILVELQQVGGALAAGSLSLVSRVASMLLDTVLVLMLSIYFSLDGARVVTWLREETPQTFRRYVRYFLEVVNQVVGGYVRGTLSMALLIGMLVGVGLGVIGVPYAVLLGVLAFFMQFVPVIGVLISGAFSLLVTLPRGTGITLGVLIYFVVVHIIESDVIGPRIMGKAIGIHPATGIIALLVGTEVFGVWGALFGAPLAGLLQAILIGIWRIRQSDPNSTAEISALVAGELDLPQAEQK